MNVIITFMDIVYPPVFYLKCDVLAPGSYRASVSPERESNLRNVVFEIKYRTMDNVQLY
jgi:hypothetical protein